MTALTELVAVLEGEGSRPLLSGAVTARGFLNLASSPVALARQRTVETIDTTLYIAAHRLPALLAGGVIVVGAIDAAATAAGDRSYIALDRVPQDDGLLHAIRLDQGVVL